MNWLGGNGFGATMTYRRNRLSGEILGQYLHKKIDSSDNSKFARFFNTVFTTKNTEKLVEQKIGDDGEDVENVISKVFQRVHVSFLPTSSCNTSTVNGLNDFKTSDMIREINNFDNRRYWGIEMNEAHQLYIGTHARIDSIDRFIKNCCMKYTLALTHASCHVNRDIFSYEM